MEKITKVLKAGALLSVIFFFSCAALFLVSVNQQLKKLEPQLQATLKSVENLSESTTLEIAATTADARRLIEIAGGTLNIARDELRDERKKMQDESSAILQTTASLNALTVQAGTVLQDMDSNSAKSLAQLDASLAGIPPLMEQSTKTMESVQKAVDSTNAVIAGPVAQTMQHTDATMQNVQETTQTISLYVKRITTPRGLVSAIWHGIVSLITPGATVAVALGK